MHLPSIWWMHLFLLYSGLRDLSNITVLHWPGPCGMWLQRPRPSVLTRHKHQNSVACSVQFLGWLINSDQLMCHRHIISQGHRCTPLLRCLWSMSWACRTSEILGSVACCSLRACYSLLLLPRAALQWDAPYLLLLPSHLNRFSFSSCFDCLSEG